MAIREGDFKLVRYDTNADTLTGVRNQPASAAKLYNLASDVGETNDLAATMPEKVEALQSKWDTWNTSNIRPHWGSSHTDDDGAQPGTRPPKKPRKGNQAAGGK